MEDQTALDTILAAAAAAPEDTRRRLLAHLAILNAELHLVLAADHSPGSIEPLIVETPDGPIALAFDTGDRLAGFIDRPTPVAVLSGRATVALLDGRGIGLGINLAGQGAPFLLDPEGISWTAALIPPDSASPDTVPTDDRA